MSDFHEKMQDTQAVHLQALGHAVTSWAEIELFVNTQISRYMGQSKLGPLYLKQVRGFPQRCDMLLALVRDLMSESTSVDTLEKALKDAKDLIGPRNKFSHGPLRFILDWSNGEISGNVRHGHSGKETDIDRDALEQFSRSAFRVLEQLEEALRGIPEHGDVYMDYLKEHMSHIYDKTKNPKSISFFEYLRLRGLAPRG